MGFFNARTKEEGDSCPKADTLQVKSPETADVAIHTVGDARTKQAAGFLRYLKPRQEVHRQCIYLSHEMHGELSRIIRTLGVNGSTVGEYIENVLEEHLRAYGDDINILVRRETSQPL